MEGEVVAGRFTLERLLGRGAMSEVWLATDRELGRQVAVKLHAVHADPARFEREARAAAGLSHENVASVYDFGEEEGRPYLVLEHLPGGTLEDRLSDGRPLPDAESGRIAAELAAGLAHAHANGVVHRDLKPSNVLFDPEGRAKLSDFGIARAAGQATLTETGTVLGTAGYIAPEQATGDPVGPAADVYSFGVILFRMLTGRLPFVADHPVELALKHRDEAPPAIRDVRPDAPASLAAIVSTALEKDPARRPPDGAALAAALAEPPTLALARSGPRAEVRPAPVPATPRRRWDRRRSIAALAVAAVLFGGGLAAALLIDTGGSSPSLSTQATTHHRRTTSSTSATTGATTTTSQSTTAATTTAAQTTSPGTTAATTTAATTTTSTTIPATTAPTTP